MHPVLFSIQLGDDLFLSMSSYRFFGSLAFLVWLHLTITLAQHQGYSSNRALVASMACILSALLGSFLASHLIYFGFSSILDLSLAMAFKTKASYGAFFLGTAVLLFSCKLLKLPALNIADLWAPIMALSMAVARIGCLLAGCCYGLPTSVPWGLFFPDMTVLGGTIRHPTQIYMSLGNVTIFLLLKWIHAMVGRKKPGLILLLFFALHSTMRAIIQPFRCHHPLFPQAWDNHLQTLFLLSMAGLAWLAVTVRSFTESPVDISSTRT